MANISLLSTTTRVESPYIQVDIGDYTFGVYNKSSKTKVDKNGLKYTEISTTFPNFMRSLEVTKINGAVNSYTIQMIYGITAGDDPNLLEKVFSSVQKSRRLTISYGDYCTPTFIYKKESTVIKKIISSVDMKSSSISYTIECVSDALNLTAGVHNFPARYAKPSDVIKELIYNSSYGILEVFYGMRNKSLVLSKGLIAGDDREVQIQAKTSINIFDYLNYLVTCMSSVTDSPNSVIKSLYAFTVYDDITDAFGGPYFKVAKVDRDIKPNNSIDMYEIDIGYPSQNIVTDFSIEDNQTYSILYDYSQKIEQADYIYRIDNDGKVNTVYSPTLTNSKEYLKTTESDKNWWTKMTQMTLRVNVTIKGLLRPAILMNYVKLNVYFYGRKHISSGIYIITKQRDVVDSSGYRTTLSLTRVSGVDEI